MATANERILDKLDTLTAASGEIKGELIEHGMKLEDLARYQALANGRTGKLEARMDAQEEKEHERQRQEAYAKGLKTGAEGVFMTKKQVGAVIAGIPVLFATLEAVLRYFT